MQCSVTAEPATQPDTATAAAPATDDDDVDDADDATDANVMDEVCDSWQMDSLSPPTALFQPLKYHSMHIFVSCYQHIMLFAWAK